MIIISEERAIAEVMYDTQGKGEMNPTELVSMQEEGGITKGIYAQRKGPGQVRAQPAGHMKKSLNRK